MSIDRSCINIGMTPYITRRAQDYAVLCFTVSSNDDIYNTLKEQYATIMSGSDVFHIICTQKMMCYSKSDNTYIDSCNVVFTYVKDGISLTDDETQQVVTAMHHVAIDDDYSYITDFIGGKRDELC